MWEKYSYDSTPTCNHSDVVSRSSNHSVARVRSFYF